MRYAESLHLCVAESLSVCIEMIGNPEVMTTNTLGQVLRPRQRMLAPIRARSTYPLKLREGIPSFSCVQPLYVTGLRPSLRIRLAIETQARRMPTGIESFIARPDCGSVDKKTGSLTHAHALAVVVGYDSNSAASIKIDGDGLLRGSGR